NSSAVERSADPDRCCEASSANVVLQDTANALSRLVLPRCSLSKLWNVRPPMSAVGGQGTVLAGLKPFLVRAEAVTILNVDPGGNSPSSARSNPPGRSIIASTRP